MTSETRMMIPIQIQIPPCYYFVPTDEELIVEYLLNKSMGLPLPWNPISEKVLYGEDTDPWDVLGDAKWDMDHHYHHSSDKQKTKRVTYVFTRLKSRINGKSRIARTTRSGTWKGQTSGKEIKNEFDQLIGLSKMFTFYHTNSNNKAQEHDHWIMHEFSLAGVCLNLELKYRDYVICKISRTTTSKEKQQQQLPIIIPQHQQNYISNGAYDDQLLADEIEQAMASLPEENQTPVIPQDDQLLLGIPKLGTKRSAAEEEFEEEARCKMQKTTTTTGEDQFVHPLELSAANFDFDFNADIDLDWFS